MDPNPPTQPAPNSPPTSNQPVPLTPEQTTRIQEILAHPTDSPAQPEKKSSTGWAIFWLIVFTPVGWYFIIKKTTWPTWVKILVILLTVAAFIGLTIETELIAFQVTSALGGVDSNLPGLGI